jgi:hypothetical protein
MSDGCADYTLDVGFWYFDFGSNVCGRRFGINWKGSGKIEAVD